MGGTGASPALVWIGLAPGKIEWSGARALRPGVPGLSIALGHAYLVTPTFGVPCPTTIFSAGVLLTCRRLPLLVTLIPLVWSLIGGSAAVLLGVAADYVLLACAPVLVAHLLKERTR